MSKLQALTLVLFFYLAPLVAMNNDEINKLTLASAIQFQQIDAQHEALKEALNKPNITSAERSHYWAQQNELCRQSSELRIRLMEHIVEDMRRTQAAQK